MSHGRRATSALSRKITQYRSRGGNGDENTAPQSTTRATVKRSMATAEREREEQATKRRKVLADLEEQARTRTEAGDDNDPAVGDGEWEDEPFNFDFGDALGALAPGTNGQQSDVDASAGTFVPSSILPNARIDTRTREDQIKAQTAAWQHALPQLVDAFLAWKHAAAVGERASPPTEPTQPPTQPAEPPVPPVEPRTPPVEPRTPPVEPRTPPVEPRAQPAEPSAQSADSRADGAPVPVGGDWFTVAAIRDTAFERHMRIVQEPGEMPIVALMRAGMMGCTPSVPVVAISLGLLDLYYRLRRHAPRLGIQPFVRALCDKYMCQYRPYLRDQFSNAFDAYLAVQREIQRRLDCALGQDSPHWRALNACAPCNYELEDEEPLIINGLLAMDGGQAHKRRAGAGIADKREFDSDYRIPPAEVDLCANEVTKHVVPKKKTKKQADNNAPLEWETLQEPGEPGDDAPHPSVCADRWRNAKAEHRKTAPDAYEQTGVFVCLCRHGLVLWFVEMIRSGELAKYPLAVIARMIRAGIRCRRCAYDIGCAFQGTLERSKLLGAPAREASIDSGLNAFHGYGHNRLCQLGHHPLYEPGFGLEDLETCERFFSWLNGVGGVLRHASHFHWVQFVDLAMRQWDEDKYAETSRFLYNNVRQATTIIAELQPLVDSFKQQMGVTDEEIESWNALELEYLQGLQSEPEEVALRLSYASLLGELNDAETFLASKQENFRDGIQPPTAQEIAAKRLSSAAAQKLYKARVDAHDKYMKTLDAVLAAEAMLTINERWRLDSREYQDALKQIAERDWRKALDRLELLMVQRMFELAKSHTFGTGYKMREAIGKGLKARSQAIRTAVTRYNELAQALTPPAPTVEFSTLMEWTELQEFELLRHSRAGDVRNSAWAQPANRAMAVKHYKLLRAREELTRCRVEVRRLVTAMRDEETRYDQTIQRLLDSGNVLAYELGEYSARRKAVNTVHGFRLAKLAAYDGFATALIPGRRVGHDAAAPVDNNGVRAQDNGGHDPVLQSDVLEDLDAVDPVLEEDLNVLHDFLAELE